MLVTRSVHRPIVARNHLLRRHAVLSGIGILSATLGLGREALVLVSLGASQANDALQATLTVTYLVSMLGDAGRTTVLASLGHTTPTVIVRRTGFVIVGIATLIAVTSALFLPQAKGPFILAGTVGGMLNIAVAMAIAFWQAINRPIQAQILATLSNIVIFLIVGIATWLHLLTPELVVTATVVAPLVQLVIFLSVATKQRPDRIKTANAASSSSIYPARIFLHSAVGVGGAQLGQLAARAAVAGSAVGALSVFAAVVRLFDSLRSVLLEPFVASRIARWKSEPVTLPALFHPSMIVITTTTATLVSAILNLLLPPISVASLATQYGVLVGIGTILVFITRVVVVAMTANTPESAPFLKLSIVDCMIGTVLMAVPKGESAIVVLSCFFLLRPLLMTVVLWRSVAFRGITFQHQ